MFAKKAKTIDVNQVKERIRKYFLIQVPEDFFQFWTFCATLNPLNPKAALSDLGLLLVGPYDVVDEKLTEKALEEADPQSLYRYYRFFYDVPEVQTILRDTRSNVHIGYFRDDPSEYPSMVVSNDPDKSCSLNSLGDNIFSGLLSFCETWARKSGDKKAAVAKLVPKVKAFADKNDISLTNDGLKQRKKKVVAKTFHGAGIVVPVVNDVGYRPLPETDQSLKKLLKKVTDLPVDERPKSKEYESLKELVNLTNLANDESDFGMALELGIDLFCFGDPFYHKIITFLLSTSYSLLNRDDFVQLIEAHLAERKHEKVMKFSIKGK